MEAVMRCIYSRARRESRNPHNFRLWLASQYRSLVKQTVQGNCIDRMCGPFQNLLCKANKPGLFSFVSPVTQPLVTRSQWLSCPHDNKTRRECESACQTDTCIQAFCCRLTLNFIPSQTVSLFHRDFECWWNLPRLKVKFVIIWYI